MRQLIAIVRALYKIKLKRACW